MRVVDLLETAMKTGDMIVSDDMYYSKRAIRYCKELYTFIWCDRRTGEYEKMDSNECEYNRAILCSMVLKEGWYLEPIKKIEPIEINGTKFTDYDKAIEYLSKLKNRNNTLDMCTKVYKSTGIKPCLIADSETIEYINNEFQKYQIYGEGLTSNK